MILNGYLMRNRWLGAAEARRVVEEWNAVYPALREALTRVIDAQRKTERPTANVDYLVQVRRGLGQMDRGTYRSGTCPGEPVFSPGCAFRLVRGALSAVSLGHPQAGDIYRLAGWLADLDTETTARAERWWKEREA